VSEPKWRCEWCGIGLEPDACVWVGEEGVGDYCPEGRAVGSNGVSPHLPVRAAALAEREALDVERLAFAMAVSDQEYMRLCSEALIAGRGFDFREWAGIVARGYAALAKTPEEKP
jgi:hypothetical protein